MSTLDDHFATLALTSPARERIIKRNISLAQTNRKVVEQWIAEQDGLFTWVTPNAGTTGLVKLPVGVDDEKFCHDLHTDKKVVRTINFQTLMSLMADSGSCWKVLQSAWLCAIGIHVRH